MTANQLEYNKLVEQARHNRESERIDSSKLDETKRANLSNERETRRTNVAKENISREANATKAKYPWNYIALAGERAVYGTDTDAVSQDYISKGDPDMPTHEKRTYVANPLQTLKNIYDNAKNKWQELKSGKSARGGGRI